ncbi:DEP domain-containing protein 1A isoform X1 [Gadus macrocephalus]|uniref:DEP domain-containing protein 1A isoform X1 n=1 Tax=Gadus macrocephalus TaxID=80720 RepID=UPI0028CB2E14|nr:DEP domain-containing protein 1A isoform X1 [Gadus macrocephalus]
MNTHIVTPGPYRATKLWNEVTRLFRSGMPIRKHRQNFRVHSACFMATAAVDWLHQLLCSNSNFGPDVTRQQTVQLLKKFLKNHVIEDVKGRWGSEDLEDNGSLYRFPSTSPLKPIPSPAPKQTSTPGSSLKRSLSLRDKEGLFRFRSTKKLSKETQENVDPALQAKAEVENQPIGEQQAHKQEFTEEEEHEIWKEIALTHLQKILGIASLDEVLDRRNVNPQNIIHNMTKVNKHGVVTLDDKSNDLPHWVLSAMKSLANWPKYDSVQPSYPGFERDVFKTVSDYFYSLAQPLLTFQLYELFINVLVLCGYVVAAPRPQRAKGQMPYPPCFPPSTKTSFCSTECLLLSLIRQGSCDEADSPMKEVFSSVVQSQLPSFKGVEVYRQPSGCDVGGGTGQLGGRRSSLSQSRSSVGPARPRPRSCSMENVLEDSTPLTQQLFLSNECLSGSTYGDLHHAKHSKSNSKHSDTVEPIATAMLSDRNADSAGRKRLSLGSLPGLAGMRRTRLTRPFSTGSCLDIVLESREEVSKETMGRSRAASCLDVSTPARRTRSTSTVSTRPSSSGGQPCSSWSSSEAAQRHVPSTTRPQGSSTSSSTISSSLWSLHGGASAGCGPTIARRCHSSLDLSGLSQPPLPNAENSLLQSNCERVAIEALQLCTLLLPPASRRKLQLLMRMMSRISHNVDMPRLHHAIGARTLMVHTFSGCVLGSAVECELDELLATRLVSFLMDHQHTILSVPEYLLTAVTDHVQYLRSAQLGPASRGAQGVDMASAPMLLHAFCRQISSVEFEEQRVAASHKAMEDLLEILLTDRSITDKDRQKRLKQFRKQYPDIYSRRIPASDREEKKPKIKPPLLTIRKTKAFSIRN